MAARFHPTFPLLAIALLAGCGDDSSADGTSAGQDAAPAPTSGGDAGPGASPTPSGTSATPAPYDCGDDGTDWNLSWQALECEVIDIVNARRATGADCGAQGDFDPADELEPHAVLTANAREHSEDMVTNDYFAQDAFDGTGVFDWALADYDGTGSASVDIAAGQTDPMQLVDAFIGSDANCGNLLRPDARFIGVGYAEAGGAGDAGVDGGAGALGSKWTLVIAN